MALIEPDLSAFPVGDHCFGIGYHEIHRCQSKVAFDSSKAGWRSYSIGSFEYLVNDDSEISMSHAH
ncbi:hypothetical protein CFP56_007984 [Quercus suber]|uniref:Uncharacterized protein n=1 Tax=Quercus suber TaxID=58331 RepID=A0AAW0L557_QUESU